MTGADHRSRGWARVLDLPELNVVIFTFLLNVVWEFWHTPFYRDLPAAPHWQATKLCSLAVVARSRAWLLEPSAMQVDLFTIMGVLVTVIAE